MSELRKEKKIEATYKIISGALQDRIFTETISHKRKLLPSKEDFQERSIMSSMRYCRDLYSNLKTEFPLGESLS